ncbi:histone-fold-containing protein [Cristinia sonorae]|uniref:Histone-fold-containing protein n=1 Tax=Cristinia sonorae TaxID=1940300 RepID=A0A8K0UKJ4_9AGAR|nr:histone-fold-containing protein [Cristinia sonorae]
MEDSQVDSMPIEESVEDSAVPPTSAPKTKKGAAAPAAREPGKSSFPVSRVQKIMKADKELPMVAREATFLISVATEEFIKRLAEESSIVAARENRVTIQYRDLATIVRRVEKFMFLDEIIPFQPPPAPAKRKAKAQNEDSQLGRTTTMLDAFVARAQSPEGPDEDIIMNEDGTMSANPS